MRSTVGNGWVVPAVRVAPFAHSEGKLASNVSIINQKGADYCVYMNALAWRWSSQLGIEVALTTGV